MTHDTSIVVALVTWHVLKEKVSVFSTCAEETRPGRSIAGEREREREWETGVK